MKYFIYTEDKEDKKFSFSYTNLDDAIQDARLLVESFSTNNVKIVLLIKDEENNVVEIIK